MSQELIQTLDALINERPEIIQAKRKHFSMDEGPENQTKEERLEWMRLNAERDRVIKFKDIVGNQSQSYYNILRQFVKMLEIRKDAGVPTKDPA